MRTRWPRAGAAASLSAVVLPGWHDPAQDFYKILVDSDGRLTRREAATPRWISAKGGYGSNLGLWRNPARETSDAPADHRIAPLAAPAVPLIAGPLTVTVEIEENNDSHKLLQNPPKTSVTQSTKRAKRSVGL